MPLPVLPQLGSTRLGLFSPARRLPRHLELNALRRIQRQGHRCRAEGQMSKEQDPQRKKQLEEVVQGRVEEAAKMLDDIIDDIVCDLSTVHSMGYIYNEVPAETEGQVIRKVIQRYLGRLDQNFLASLEPFQQKANRMRQPEVARLIGQIRLEVVAQTNEQFPPQVLLLEDLMRISNKEERIEKIKKAADEPEVDRKVQDTQMVSSDDPESVEFDTDLGGDAPIEEMDLKKELERLKIFNAESSLKSLKQELDKEVDRPLVIEEPSEFEEVMGSVNGLLDDCEPDQKEGSRNTYGKSITPLELELAANQFISDMEEKEEIANRQLLAKLCIIREEARLVHMERRFAGLTAEESPMKMRENVPSQVVGVIQMLIKTNDALKRVGLIRKTFEKDDYAPATRDLTRAPGYVRPGIFMTALTMAQMEADQKSTMEATASEISSQFLQRIDDIRLEAMLVLREIGWGEFNSEELAQRQQERAKRRKQIKEEYLQTKDT